MIYKYMYICRAIFLCNSIKFKFYFSIFLMEQINEITDDFNDILKKDLLDK